MENLPTADNEMTDDSPLDMDDPHEAHAVFALQFYCERCGKVLEANFEEELYSDAWYRRLASLAKAQQWFAPAVDADGRMHVMRSWCPECAMHLGIVPDENGRAAPLPPSDFEPL